MPGDAWWPVLTHRICKGLLEEVKMILLWSASFARLHRLRRRLRPARMQSISRGSGARASSHTSWFAR
jgi:hypothetical protein